VSRPRTAPPLALAGLLGGLLCGLIGCDPARLPFRVGGDSAVDTATTPTVDTGPTGGRDTVVDTDTDHRPPTDEGCEDSGLSLARDVWETLGDELDSDCDGAINRARLRGLSVHWEAPRTPVALVGERWMIVGALHADGAGGTQASALVLDRRAEEEGYRELTLATSRLGATQAGLELELIEDILVGAMGGRDVEGRRIVGHSWDPASGAPPSALISRHGGSGDYLEVDMAANVDRWITVGCTPTSLDIMSGVIPPPDATGLATPQASFTLEPSDADFTACFAEVDEQRAWATACGGTGCQTWAVDRGGTTRVDRWVDQAFRFVDAPGRWIVGSEGAGERLTALYFPGSAAEEQALPRVFADQAIRSASAAWLDDGGDAVMAIAGTIPIITGYDVLLALRWPDGRELTLPVVEGVLDAEVSVSALGDTLLVAVVITEAKGTALRWATYRLVSD